MNLKEAYSPLVYKLIPFYSLILIFFELFLFKINSIKDDSLISISNLIIILLNFFILLIYFINIEDISPTYKRDFLLLLFVILGAIGFVLFLSNYSIINLLFVVFPCVVFIWFLSSPLITDWTKDKLSDQEIHESFLFNKKYLPIIQKYLSHTFLIFLCSFIVVPVWWILDTSLSSGNSLSLSEPFKISDWSGEHFSNIFSS